jgi:hypothetical protein
LAGEPVAMENFRTEFRGNASRELYVRLLRRLFFKQILTGRKLCTVIVR